jgi:ATP phosphoribosyltransferase regulatory subunit HisZ
MQGKGGVVSDHEEADRVEKIRKQVRKFKKDKGNMTIAEILELTDTLADEWHDEQERIFIEKQTGACRACGRYRKGP